MYVSAFPLRHCLLLLLALAEFSNVAVNSDKICPLLKLVNGRTRYKFRGRNVRFNCMRGFQLVGAKYASCMNGKWDAVVPICVKYGCLAPSTTHVNGQFIESYRGAVVKIVCNPGYDLVGSPSVYCNGFRWNETFPVCKVTNKEPALSCDFETEDLCGWNQDPMHDDDWRRRNVGTPTVEVGGPQFDNTLGLNGTGHFMHLGIVHGYKSGMENETARLYSPVYPSEYSGGSCFTFWYYMSGGNAGTLKVFVKPEGVELYNLIPSFWMSGDQGNKWSQGFIFIQPTEFPFQVVIEGIRRSGFASDVAFDDVKISFGNDCIFLENLTSTEFSTSVGQFDEQQDEDSPASCRNRCNSTSTVADDGPEKICDCQEECVEAKTCCSDFFDFCTVSVSTTTKWEGIEFSPSGLFSPASNPAYNTEPHVDLAAFAPTDNNKQSNEIDPENPSAGMPAPDRVDRNDSREIKPNLVKSQTSSTAAAAAETTTAATTTTAKPTVHVEKVVPVRPDAATNETKSDLPLGATPSKISGLRPVGPTAKSKSFVNETEVQKNWQTTTNPPKSNSTKFAKTEIDANKIHTGRNSTEQTNNQQKPKISQPAISKPIKPVGPSSASLDPQSTFNSIPVAPIRPNHHRDKVPVPVFSKDSRFRKENNKKEISGKEPPQAIKIDKDGEDGKRDFGGILGAAGICLVVAVVFIVFGVFWYRRSRNRKSERDGMLEDSDSIVYEMDSQSFTSCENQSLVYISRGHRQHQI